MKKRSFKNIFAIALAFMLLLQMLPVPFSAFAAEQQDLELSNQAPAELEFTTAPIFTRSGYESMLKCSYNIAWYDYGSYLFFLDEAGKPITSEKLESVVLVFGNLEVAKPLGTNKYAVYWKGKRISEPIYTEVFEEGDCLIGVKQNGMDFFGVDGKQRRPGTLPSGWEPRRVSAAGTVVARKYNPAIEDASGLKHYFVALFDRNGNQLYICDFTGTDENEQITLYSDQLLLVNGRFMDLYGKAYGTGGMKVFGENNDLRIVSRSQDGWYDIWNLDHQKMGSFEATELRDQVGSALIIGRNGRFGMVDQNGNVIVAPTYLEYLQTRYVAYQMPTTREVAFRTLESSYVVHNDKGTKLGEFAEPLDIFPNCMLRTGSDGSTYIYDTNGKLTSEYERNMKFKTVNGVCFLREGNSNLFYVVDLYGNRLSELGFTNIQEDFKPVYGLANVNSGNDWYVVNAAGTIVNDGKMDRAVEFIPPYMSESNPEELLGVYSMDGKNGICRYVPVINACEKDENGVHDWQVSKVLVEATCTETGKAVYQCAKCQKTRTETTPIDPDNHAWTLTEILSEAGEGETHGRGLYTCTRCGETKEDKLCAGLIFTDMPAEDNWAHNAIDWAYFTGITKGTGDNTFSPEMNCTRSQVVTFLWRAAGEPGHESEDCPFTDVEEGSFYYDAMLWAVEKGITKGTGTNTFSPNNICTRSEVVTFLWRAAGEPEPSLTESAFTDVPADTWYTQPVLWAVEHEITHGTSATTFAPTVTCSRAQIVTFLYNASKLPAATP